MFSQIFEVWGGSLCPLTKTAYTSWSQNWDAVHITAFYCIYCLDLGSGSFILLLQLFPLILPSVTLLYNVSLECNEFILFLPSNYPTNFCFISFVIICQRKISRGEILFSLFDICWIGESENYSVLSDSLLPHGLYSAWNSPCQDTGVGSLSLLQGIFPTQGLSTGLPHCRRILYQLSLKGSSQGLKQGLN